MEKFFKLKEFGTDVKTEVIAGITTFVTMAYIIFVNPIILADPLYITGNEKADAIKSAVFVATCLAAAIGTLMMALYAKIPFAQAPGMGLNAFFAYTIILGMGYTFQQGLAAVFVSGVLFIIITLLGLREMIVKAIPNNIKIALTAGIGLFIALIGLKNAGLVVANDATLVSLVNFSNITDPAVLGAALAFVGLIVIGVLYKLRVKGAILIGIAVSSILGLVFGLTDLKAAGTIVSLPPMGAMFSETFFKLDFAGLFKSDAGLFTAILNGLMIIISFTLVDMFDTIGTLIGTGKRTGYVDKDGNFPNLNKALLCDAVATTSGALLGTSTVTTYVESGSGVAEGGRTGLTSLVTGVLFILALFIAPVLGIVPGFATAPALIFVGIMMVGAIKEIELDDMTETIPAMLTIFMMPFTYSIATGIAFGLISYPILKACTGKIKEVSIVTWILALLFIIRFSILPH